MLSGWKTKVDAAYLKQIRDATTFICACTSLPKTEQIACMANAPRPYPKARPHGETPGIYELKLDDASNAQIDAERAKYMSCESAIRH